MNSIKKIFQTPGSLEIAQRELEEAKRSLLSAQTAQEFAESQVRYNEQRIKRLTTIISKAGAA